MREAVGGSLLLYLFIPIIMIIIFFIGFVMNYAAAYRAANHAITRIENCQARFDDCGNDKSDLRENIGNEIRTNYNYPLPKSKKALPLCYILNGSNSYVFRTTLPVSFYLPLVGDIDVMSVKAETKSITIPSSVNTKALSGIKACS